MLSLIKAFKASVIFVFLILSPLSASKVVLISYGNLLIPIMLSDTPPVIPAPTKIVITKPQLQTTMPSETYENAMTIEIKGQANMKVYVNGTYYGVLDASGLLNVSLNLSGVNGVKTFTIVLKDNAGNTSEGLNISITKKTDPKFSIAYKGLSFYHEDILTESYVLKPLSDSTFNTLTGNTKELIANKLLGTLFFSYSYEKLKEKLASGVFIQNLVNDMQGERTDKVWLESTILDNEKFRQRPNNEQEAINILVRFYAMDDLDSYYFENWMAYILTQTIMFSPAYELESSHAPNISRVYNRFVRMIGDAHGLRYTTYMHMMSDDNWRRFRSPEDNGREMLEIFALDMNDAHVPIVGKALQNWKLDPNNDTLVIGLNENREALSLFNTTIYSGEDFYRELSKSDVLISSVTKRLVTFFFPTRTLQKQAEISQAIVQSNPETWKDILLQIVLSEEYLLHTQRPKSVEELFFATAKKIDFKHNDYTFHQFKRQLEEMHQATMKYKLGKSTRVPLDTLSFANYHKYMREQVFLRVHDPLFEELYNAWQRRGWNPNFIDNTHFTLNNSDEESSLMSLIQYVFHVMLSRDARADELAFFKGHMMITSNNVLSVRNIFNILRDYSSDLERQEELRESAKKNVTILVLDYLSRLKEMYTFRKVD